MKTNTIILICAIVILSACNNHTLVERALKEADGNVIELKSAIEKYNDEKREIAEYVVGASWGHRGREGIGIDSIEQLYRELPGICNWLFDDSQLIRGKRYSLMPIAEIKDATVLTADYLTANIDDAYGMWKKRKWNSGLPKDIFCEMILPYRIGDESLTSWREPYKKWLQDLEDTLSECTSSVAAARIIAGRIGSCQYNDKLLTPHRSALDLLAVPVGYCREDCDRTIYAMRSMGVPVSVDRMLVSPENGVSHSWTVVWDNIDNCTRMFDNDYYLPTRDSIHYDQRRKGKIYRMTFSPDLERLARFSDKETPPGILLNPWMRDVTAEYFGHNIAFVDIWKDSGVSDRNAVYLGVFSGCGFQPIDISELQGDKAMFKDIEPNLIYAPVTFDGKVCGYPFMLRRDGTLHKFHGDENNTEKITLTRKFPVRFHLRNRLSSIVGVHVQSGSSPHGPWQEIEVIDSMPTHSYRRIILEKPLNNRYIRLFKDDGTRAFVSMVLACRDSLGLDCMPISLVGGADIHMRYGAILKDDCSFVLESGAEDCIVHVDSTDEIISLFLLPANDDNFVVPAQEYELLYFAGRVGWKSLGRKTAEGFSIDFEAPKGALLWLRNHTKGREEQIFIWDGKRQLFNVDLYNADF